MGWQGTAHVGAGRQGRGGAAKTGHISGGKGIAKGTMGAHGKVLPRNDCDRVGPTWTKPRVVLDDEGYELVQPRRIRVGAGDSKGDEGGPTTNGGGDGGAWTTNAATTTRRRWSDEDDSDDDGMGEEEVDDVAGGCGAEEDGTWEADPRELRAAYE